MEQALTAEELELISKVQEQVFKSINLGVNIAELNILDDVNASRRQIQELGSKIAVNNTELSVTILEIAQAVYFGHSLKGDVEDFFDAVIRMGADRIKLLIFSLTLFAMEKGPGARMRAAKSAGISVLGRMIAEQMGLRDDVVRKIEAGGLLSQLGKNMLLKAREMGLQISDETIRRCEIPLAATIHERMGLDPFLKKAIDLSVVEFDEDSFALAGIIKLAEALTEDSFAKFGKLVVRSPLPDGKVIVERTPGSDLKKVFSILGVEEYLEIQERPTQRQQEAAKKKKPPAK
jgi:hypothetical protein